MRAGTISPAIATTALLAVGGGAAGAAGNWAAALGLLAAYTGVTALGVCRIQLQYFGPSLNRLPGETRRVALTFDDGPDERLTPAVLDRLARRGMVATFFCVGERVAAHPTVARRIVEEGHDIGNHSHAHHPLTNLFGQRRLIADLARAQDAIEAATRARPRWLRPPVGLTNPRLFAAARTLGLSVAGWSARGLDTISCDPEKIFARLRRGVKPGAILLLHCAGVEDRVLLPALDRLLDHLETEGYTTCGLDESP